MHPVTARQTDRTENVWSARLPYFKIQDDPYDLIEGKKETVFFPYGTNVDKSEDMPTLPLSPLALGEITGISKIPLYCRPDTGRGIIDRISLKRGEKFWVYERNTAWTKAKVGEKVGFIPTKYTKVL